MIDVRENINTVRRFFSPANDTRILRHLKEAVATFLVQRLDLDRTMHPRYTDPRWLIDGRSDHGFRLAKCTAVRKPE